MTDSSNPNKIGEIPLKDGSIELFIEPGKCLYILGQNGAGKSTFLFHLAKKTPLKNLISGNREVVFGSSAVSISAAQAEQYEGYSQNHSSQPTFRSDKGHHNSGDRLSTLLFYLKSRCDDINKNYRQAHLKGENDKLPQINANEPIGLINEAIRKSSIPLTIDWDEKSSLIVTKNGFSYGVQKMSDGERSALILACEVILSKENSLIIIDEPERHLHRSISSPLLQYLKSIRPDLRWVIATHDLSLPRDDAEADVLILYRYVEPLQWEAEILKSENQLPTTLINAIYGARQKVIFIEGNSESKDAPLYQQIFKGVTVIPAGNCRDVCENVSALESLKSIHFMSARGLVDGDNRSDTAELIKGGVHPLEVYAIESVYYHPSVISEMLKHSAEKVSLQEVIIKAIDVIGDAQHLSKMTAYRSYRESHMRAMLDDTSFEAGVQTVQHIDGPSLIAACQANFNSLKKSMDWAEITKLFKIKSTGAPNAIATKLGYGGSAQYERALVKLLDKDPSLFNAVRALVPDPFT
ncbi:ATP-binding cassette domain-containing protein [Pseudomonas sp. GV071]|uniref:ATP-binding cassette domain-containing protein n=1 Tax=Pseudomonas sp. GV071 TaxID=2135754 RepID=UPI000D3CAF73|nr:ATP-binding cassette domain-containing protein [Pseudomonas sp. GV071]PTQ68167.1 ABC transporter family protein [Pseudomonas sp. GV071]